MNLAQALDLARRQGLEQIDAELLLLHVLARPHERAWLRAHDDDLLTEPQQQAFAGLCRRRLEGQPLAYLVGQKEFFGLQLEVDASVLVPRPDTETLVDWALELFDARPIRALDLGTGSGAIALALKQARPAWTLLAVDASEPALAVARRNAQRLGLAVQFQAGHWLRGLAGRFELILSNPPYIAEGDAHLPALRHEPPSALVAGPDGLADLRQIIGQAPPRLAGGGWLLLEHGHDQAQAVAQLLQAAGFSRVQSRQDLAGITRCTGGRWP
jgi:release factor glutamine methyltransferase